MQFSIKTMLLAIAALAIDLRLLQWSMRMSYPDSIQARPGSGLDRLIEDCYWIAGLFFWLFS